MTNFLQGSTLGSGGHSSGSGGGFSEAAAARNAIDNISNIRVQTHEPCQGIPVWRSSGGSSGTIQPTLSNRGEPGKKNCDLYIWNNLMSLVLQVS